MRICFRLSTDSWFCVTKGKIRRFRLSLKQGTVNRGMGMGTGNGESLKWGTFKSGNL